ncbi:energy transducer TonB [Alkalimarinus sediminis]|uniref:TonB family protein n=1 Tax=Alkalimarinus sediminis TaxID=1632866 RepID=A0A9E8HHD2_9ALTE|nr:energy transducer TonB [Alkalimarinus sediminis]UZW74698.1 TonB family protein [Alkalimarinus sediminis]
MLKLVNRYLLWVALAIGLHAIVLMTWTPTLQPIQIRLQSGDQAISLQLASAEQQTSVVVASAIQKTTAQKANTQKTNNPPERLLLSQFEPSQFEPSQFEPSSSENEPSQKIVANGNRAAHEDINTNHSAITNDDTGVEHTANIAEIVKEISQDNEQAAKALTDAAVSPNSTYETTTVEASTANPVEATVIEPPSNTPPQQASPMAASKPKGVFAKARPISANTPKYPRRAIMRNQQGRVKVNLWVDESGYVDNIELIESSGYAMLDNSVFRFAEEERFVPATQDGIPVASTQSYLFRFVLK